jgi:hypothetical protein
VFVVGCEYGQSFGPLPIDVRIKDFSYASRSFSLPLFTGWCVFLMTKDVKEVEFAAGRGKGELKRWQMDLPELDSRSSTSSGNAFAGIFMPLRRIASLTRLGRFHAKRNSALVVTQAGMRAAATWAQE